MLITPKLLNRPMLKNVRLVVTVVKICLIFTTSVKAQNRILIDPGHGGKDCGSISKKMHCEKDIVLQVAWEMQSLNHTLFNNALDLYLTRYKDTLISLSDRSKLAKDLKTNVFLSLHCNHAANSAAKGIEVYVARGKFKYSYSSVWLANGLLQDFKEKLGFKIRGVKFANFQVLRENSDMMTSVLVELGFLSNKDEREQYRKPGTYKALALVLLEYLIENLDGYEAVEG
jgi:N-acetylmuramoyl-L-alanine amidase